MATFSDADEARIEAMLDHRLHDYDRRGREADGAAADAFFGRDTQDRLRSRTAAARAEDVTAAAAKDAFTYRYLPSKTFTTGLQVEES